MDNITLVFKLINKPNYIYISYRAAAWRFDRRCNAAC